MKPTKLFALLSTATLAALASGCSSGDVCSQFQSLASKNAACSGTVSAPSQSTCEATLAKCSAADQTKLENYVKCANSQPACTTATESSWSLQLLANCASDISALQTLSSACTLIPSGGTSGGTTGGSTGSGGGSTGGSTGGANPNVGTACTFDSSSPSCGPGQSPCDTCAGFSLACSNLAAPGDGGAIFTGTCQLPVEFEGCSASVGCQQSPVKYDCYYFPAQGNQPASYTCLQPCSAPTDCNTISNSCVKFSKGDTTGHCYFNVCGPGSAAIVGTANGNAFYAPCNAAGTNDGTCLPFQFAPPVNIAGLCYAGGTAAAGSACTTDRPPASSGVTTALCAQGNACVASLCATTPTDQGFCEPECGAVATADAGAATDAGPGCASADTCVGIGALQGGLWGVCGATCTAPSGNPTGCPGGSTCSAPNSNCYALTADGGSGACLP